MIASGMLFCGGFLISVCMFSVSNAFLISIATVIVRAVKAIWLKPFATALINVCSFVTVVVSCFVLVLCGCCDYDGCTIHIRLLYVYMLRDCADARVTTMLV